MGAIRPKKRRVTAKSAAAQLGISERTVRNLVAQPRDQWRAEHAARREAIRSRHDDDGLSWQQVADEYGISRTTAIRLAYKAREERAAEQAEREQPPLFNLPHTG